MRTQPVRQGEATAEVCCAVLPRQPMPCGTWDTGTKNYRPRFNLPVIWSSKLAEKNIVEIAEGSEEPRVELESFVPYRLSVLSNFVSSSIATIYSERFNISIMEWRVIAVLGNYQPLSANEICERTNMDKVQVSRAVSSLTKSGRVLRKTDKKDRRRSQLRLAAKGMKVYQQIVPLALERERQLLAPFNAREIKEFDRLLSKLEKRARELCITT